MMGIAFIGGGRACPTSRRRRIGRRRSSKDRQTDRQEIRRQGRRGRRRQHGGDPRRFRIDDRVDYSAAAFKKIDAQAGADRAAQRFAVGGDVPDRWFVGAAASSTASISRHGRQALPRRDDRRSAGLPGTGLFMPAGTAGSRTKACSGAPCRSSIPTSVPAAWNARWSARMRRSRTRCMTSTNCCSPASTQLDITEAQREAMRGQVIFGVTEGGARGVPPEQDAARFPRTRRRSAGKMPTGRRRCWANFTKLVDVLADVSGRQDASVLRCDGEKAAGTGGLFAANIDPWKCTGCLECVDVCGPEGARPKPASRTRRCCRPCSLFRLHEQDAEHAGTLRRRRHRTRRRIKRLLLDRANYYSTTGGHGGCAAAAK